MENNIGRFIAKRAQLSPRSEAVYDVTSGSRLSYPELNARVNRAANALQDGGLGAGERVATLLMNGPEFVETFLGAAKAGAVIVALNWRLVAEELSFILTDSGATVMVFGSAFNDIVTELRGREVHRGHITRWIHVGDADERPEFAEGFEDVMAAASDTEPEISVGDDDLLFIMYTSGTTGLPKGVMHSHSTTMWSLITAASTADVRWDDRYLICLPMFHVGALNPMLTTLFLGGTAVIMSEFDPVRIWEIFGEEKITITLAVPAMLQFMLLTYDAAKHDHSSLRWVMSGAAPVPETLIETYESMGIEVHQVYGLTESCGPGCLISPRDALERAGSTGKAFFFGDVRIVDSAGNDVGPHEPGEVLLRGPNIMVGYWNRSEATAETIVDGWLKTGDIAVYDEDDFIYIQDRVKDMIISGGENVYPAEIENVILSLEGVNEVAVIGIESQRWGESPLAVVVRGDEAVTSEAVLDHTRARLAAFKQPKAVRFVDTIPRNPTGKVLKRVLREQFVGVKVD